MTSELKAARERLRRNEYEDDPHHWPTSDFKILANNDLAEHPADDDAEPEYNQLRAEGWTFNKKTLNEWSHGGLRYYPQRNLVSFYRDPDRAVILRDDVTTRGQLRRLVAALEQPKGN